MYVCNFNVNVTERGKKMLISAVFFVVFFSACNGVMLGVSEEGGAG
jgi:hypothetical protein